MIITILQKKKTTTETVFVVSLVEQDEKKVSFLSPTKVPITFKKPDKDKDIEIPPQPPADCLTSDSFDSELRSTMQTLQTSPKTTKCIIDCFSPQGNKRPVVYNTIDEGIDQNFVDIIEPELASPLHVFFKVRPHRNSQGPCEKLKVKCNFGDDSSDDDFNYNFNNHHDDRNSLSSNYNYNNNNNKNLSFSLNLDNKEKNTDDFHRFEQINILKRQSVFARYPVPQNNNNNIDYTKRRLSVGSRFSCSKSRAKLSRLTEQVEEEESEPEPEPEGEESEEGGEPGAQNDNNNNILGEKSINIFEEKDDNKNNILGEKSIKKDDILGKKSMYNNHISREGRLSNEILSDELIDVTICPELIANHV